MVVVQAPMSPVRRVPEKSMQPHLWHPLMYRTNLPNVRVGFLLAGKQHFPYQLFRDSRKFRGHFQRLPHRSLCRQWFRFANHLRDTQGAHFGLHTQPQNSNPQRSRWQCISGQCDGGMFRVSVRRVQNLPHSSSRARILVQHIPYRQDRAVSVGLPMPVVETSHRRAHRPAFLNLPIAALTSYT